MSIVPIILGFTPMQQDHGRHRKPEPDLSLLERSDDAWLAASEGRCVGSHERPGHVYAPCPEHGSWSVTFNPGPFCPYHAARRVRMRDAMRGVR